MIVDAVGVTETDLADTQPLDRKPTVPLERLLKQVSFGNRDPERDLHDRRTDRPPRPPADKRRPRGARGARRHDAARADARAGRLRSTPTASSQPRARPLESSEPTAEQLAAAAKQLLDDAVEPLATNPELRERLVEVRRSYEQTIDEISKDEVLAAGYSHRRSRPRPRRRSSRSASSSSEHKDEITALQILYSRPYQQRLTFKEIKELAHAIGRPPYQWTPETLWQAYETLDRSKVRGSGGRVLTDIVSLVRFALEQDNELVPYPERVS